MIIPIVKTETAYDVLLHNAAVPKQNLGGMLSRINMNNKYYYYALQYTLLLLHLVSV